MRSIEERLRALEKAACCKKPDTFSGEIPGGEYRMALFPEGSAPATPVSDIILGEALEENVKLNDYGYYFYLGNGNIAVAAYCQSVLKNEVLIYEAYDLQTLENNNGYWIAVKVDPSNPDRLIKVAELPMTDQFWDWWYNYTVKDGADNQVKFVSHSNSNDPNALVESSIVTLTFANNALTVEEEFLTFNGHTFKSLYGEVTGLTTGELEVMFIQIRPEWITDDDYYGMGIGDDYGWLYYRSNDFLSPDSYKMVGINILTEEVRFLNVEAELNNVTNFDFSGYLNKVDSLGLAYSHPSGLVFGLADANLVENADSGVGGVTAFWSPYWENKTEVMYIIARNRVSFGKLVLGNYALFNYSLTGTENGNWYWDSNNFYFWVYDEDYYASLIVYAFNIKTRERTTWNTPIFVNFGDLNPNMSSSWANNNSMFITLNTNNGGVGKDVLTVFTEKEVPLRLHTNALYPTNVLPNKVYNTWNGMNTSFLGIGVIIDEWKNVKL